ncbi:YdcF family protein [Nostoc spongiaeforme FACHB-130]|uniref:YdcF family protein n=1 Tax=Nostoc spongiaeforme FACHB-130 TaxID=1357510 RepID=A0ABR8FVU8_9NOSO|nr:ElyC/SanA/YdcF family protein [Nostoc spongiaeforme]MBD2595299.1 YdcF family protein [Nostoc spongiaeforme FACHB-130]
MWLIKRQEIWTLTAQGWALCLAVLASNLFFIIRNLHSFLAVTAPIKSADTLVIDGWICDYALEQAAGEFKSGSYRQIITIGSKVEQGFYLAEYQNFAEIAALTLAKLGVPPDKLIIVPTPSAAKDRTNASAAALLQYISEKNLPIESINLLTIDAHGRRSWLIFRNIFAPKIQVGIISAKTKNYDPQKWWSSSEGVRVVISEAIAYVYAKLVSWKL